MLLTFRLLLGCRFGLLFCFLGLSGFDLGCFGLFLGLVLRLRPDNRWLSKHRKGAFDSIDDLDRDILILITLGVFH